jgi:deazaflavin-dependent oxidoreductase (nitroreductase family)
MPIRQSIQSRNPTIVTNFKNAATKAATRMHRAVFDASDGRVAGQVAGLPVLKLTTTGRKSGVARATMLTAALHDDHRIIVVASNRGAHSHPAWYLNLRDQPEVTVTMNGRRTSMAARTATSEEKAELWHQIVHAGPGYDDYETATDRDIPVVILERVTT